jgi:hypothetical protein
MPETPTINAFFSFQILLSEPRLPPATSATVERFQSFNRGPEEKLAFDQGS